MHEHLWNCNLGGIVNVAYAELLYYEHLALKQFNILTVTMR